MLAAGYIDDVVLFATRKTDEDDGQLPVPAPPQPR
jgi:hypothetical protein